MTTHTIRKVLPWIGVVGVCAVFFPIAVGSWSRQTTIELSWAGRAIIFAAFMAGSVLGAWSYGRDSSSRFGTAQQINLRERDRSAWLRRGVVTTIGTGVFVAVVSTFWVHGIVPHLSGKQTQRVATVHRVIGGGIGNRWCTHFVIVQFDDRRRAKICTEEDGPSHIMPEAISLKEGDSVVVTLKETVLGVSADLAG